MKRRRIHRGVGHRGFTLMETIVVVMIVGILAGLMLPRMINVGRRTAENESNGVQRLLSVAAEKCAVWGQTVAVDCITDSSDVVRLSVWSQIKDPKAGEDATGSARVRWRQDPLVEPVALDKLRVAQASQDGQILPTGKWRVSFVPGQARAELTLRLEPKAQADGPRWIVTLAPDQTAAVRDTDSGTLQSGRGPAVTRSRSIDLDDAGKGQTPW